MCDGLRVLTWHHAASRVHPGMMLPAVLTCKLAPMMLPAVLTCKPTPMCAAEKVASRDSTIQNPIAIRNVVPLSWHCVESRIHCCLHPPPLQLAVPPLSQKKPLPCQNSLSPSVTPLPLTHTHTHARTHSLSHSSTCFLPAAPSALCQSLTLTLTPTLTHPQLPACCPLPPCAGAPSPLCQSLTHSLTLTLSLTLSLIHLYPACCPLPPLQEPHSSLTLSINHSSTSSLPAALSPLCQSLEGAPPRGEPEAGGSGLSTVKKQPGRPRGRPPGSGKKQPGRPAVARQAHVATATTDPAATAPAPAEEGGGASGASDPTAPAAEEEGGQAAAAAGPASPGAEEGEGTAASPGSAGGGGSAGTPGAAVRKRGRPPGSKNKQQARSPYTVPFVPLN